MPAYSLMEKSLFCTARPTSEQNVALTDGLMVRSDTLFNDAPNGIVQLNRTSVITDTVGVKLAQVFRLRLPDNFSCSGTVRGRVKWRVVNPAPGGVTGRVNLDVQRSGVAIPNLAKSSGPTRVVDGPLAVDYTETWLAVAIPAGTVFVAGSTLDVIVEFEVMAAVVGAALEIGLHINPAILADALVVEIDTGA